MFNQYIEVVELEKELADNAKRFAQAVVETTDYSDANQGNREKVIHDHFISKLGEEAVKKLLTDLGYAVRGPDYTIYPKFKKSWDSDLYVGGLGLAVKTQSLYSARRFGLSWTFGCLPSRRDPILDQPSAWVFFVEYFDTTGALLVFPPQQIGQLSFSDPVLPYLVGKKKVVYANL
jgi:hypothetical protein